MTHRKWMLGTLAATFIVAGTPLSAMAAWNGIRHFICDRGSWAFDGLYGPYTRLAVLAYQENHGLVADGIAGPKTFAALGLRYHRTLTCGIGGNDVFLLQQTLAADNYWYGAHGRGNRIRNLGTPRPVPTPEVPTPMPTQSPGWISPPVIFTPSPVPTEAPTEMPTVAPATPMPTLAPSPSPMPTPAPVTNQPTLDVSVGSWFVPANAGALNYDFSFQRPTWTADAALWWGNWGLGGDLTVFNQTFVTFKPNPYFMANTYMYDALLKYRFDNGFEQVFAGYRGIGVGDLNFGTVGVALDRPLWSDWLWLQAKGSVGSNFGNAYFLDGNAGLALRVNPLSLEVGFRDLALESGADQLFNINGPTANVRLAF
ncbi:MAG TPA: peptidoglycan-binding protein [Oscillatoriaceae cyanobacterium]